MSKKLCALLLLAILAVPAMAQQSECKGKKGVVYSPQKGQWQVNLNLGSNGFYNEATESYLLPSGYANWDANSSYGLESPEGVDTYLNINGINYNSIGTIAGLQGKYFVTDCVAINASFSMAINLTPSKNFVEGDAVTVPDMVIPSQRYINASMKNNWYVSVGADRYFSSERFARVHPYLGAAVGFQMARITSSEPYTGLTYDDGTTNGSEANVPAQVYQAGIKCGQLMGIKAAAVAGIEYSLAPGFLLGFEFHPAAYRYDIIQLAPKGFDKYNATNHNIKVFDMPMLKLGFRF